MKIKEKDIFNYVFNKTTLKWSLISPLLDNPEFIEKLQNYENLKVYLEHEKDDLTIKTKQKLNNKIKLYSLEEELILRPLPAQISRNYNETYFSNSDYSMLAKKVFLPENNSQQIYFFSTENKELNNLKVTLYPSKKVISHPSDENPIIISLNEKIESIEINFN